MKVLTKPVKSPLSSPRIYGYEDAGIQLGHWVHDPPNAVVQYGNPVQIVWVTKYYNCEAGGAFCVQGQTSTVTDVW